MTLIGAVKAAVIGLSQRTGVLDRVRVSAWRRRRLLILCYHGISIDDEHEWNSNLYLSPSVLRRRMEILRDGGNHVISLDEGVRRLHDGSLPEGAVCLTFDDGTSDFYARAFPILQEFGFPATVYQTTYYADFNRPVYDTFVSYLLWKARGATVDLSPLLKGSGEAELGRSDVRNALHAQLLRHAVEAGLSAADKDALLVRLAERIGVDIEPLLARRILHIMNPDEVRELSQRGIDFQLHTHRHRMPADAQAFARELADNRAWIHAVTGRDARHFCYPSGEYRREQLEWLRANDVISATTCDPGMATLESEMLLLPRFVDTTEVSDLVFEAWASGVAEILPRRTRLAHPDRRDA